MTTGDGSSRDGDATAADDPVVVDLDAPEPDPGEAPTADSRSPRLRTLTTVAVLLGVLVLGVFLGHLNARNAAANNLRVVPGDLVVSQFLMNPSQWSGSLTVINDGEQPVDVVGMEVPGFDLAMTAESLTVPPGERAAAEMTLSPDCDALTPPDTNAAATTERPVALEVTTANGEYTLETPIAIAPAQAMESVNAACRQDDPDIRAQVEITATNDARPDGSLPTRATVRVHDEGVEGDVIDMRSQMPGFTVTTDSLPTPVGASPAVIDVTWTVDDCALATATDSLGYQSHVGVSIRAEADGQMTERLVQRPLSGDIVLQLGLLAASSCPS